MTLLAALLAAVGAAALLSGLPPLFAPAVVRDAAPAAHADRIGDRRARRGVGAGLVSVGGSTLLIADGLGA